MGCACEAVDPVWFPLGPRFPEEEPGAGEGEEASFMQEHPWNSYYEKKQAPPFNEIPTAARAKIVRLAPRQDNSHND